MRARIRALLIPALLSLACLFAGCPQGAPSNEIRLGVAGPFTGSAAAFGEMIRKATDLKIEQVNAAGGVNGKKVVIVYEDDRGNTTEAANVSRKLASDKSISAIIGHFNSTCSNAAKKEYNRKGVISLSPGSTNVSVCEGSEWTFRNLYRDDYQGTFLARYALNKLKVKKVAIFFDNDDYGVGLKDAFQAEAQKIGLEVIDTVPYTRERTQDFKPLVGKVQGKGVEAAFIAGLFNEAALVTKSIRNDFSLEIPILAGDGVLNDKFIEIAGEAAEGTYVTTPFLFQAAENKEMAKSFYDAFKAKFNNREPDTWAALTYDAVGMTLDAIKEVGTDRKKIKEWFAARTSKDKAYVGVTGPTYFDDEGDCFSKGAHVALVKNKKFDVAPEQLKID